MRAFADINYDEKLNYKPEYEEYLNKLNEEWMKR